MAGAHKSPYRGFAIEFSQHREYVPGDDTRHLDWKVLGRSDRYYIKQYEQETNYVAHILLDGSESMKYGSGAVTKFDYARTIAACLAYLILLQRDAASLAIFDTALRDFHPRTDNLSSIHNMAGPSLGVHAGAADEHRGRPARDGAAGEAQGASSSSSAISSTRSMTCCAAIQHLRFNGSEVIVFHVLDPFETRVPVQGGGRVSGARRRGEHRRKAGGGAEELPGGVQSFVDRLRDGCERNGCNYVQVNTAQTWHEVAQQLPRHAPAPLRLTGRRSTVPADDVPESAPAFRRGGHRRADRHPHAS